MRSTTTFFLSLSSLALSRNFSTAGAVEVGKEDRIRGAFFGSLVADALCLGSHYEYDAGKIKKAYNNDVIKKYMAPGEEMGGETHGVGWGARNYHPGTIAGDQTDYGEYNVLILEHLAQSSDAPHPFDVEELIPTWQERLTSSEWKQWICTMTKTTYQQIQQGVPVHQLGGNSNAMALRYASVFAYYDNEDDVVTAALKSMFTHRDKSAQLGAEFFARVVFRIIHSGENNLSPRLAIDQVTQDMNEPWITSKVAQAIAKFEEATDEAKPLAAEEFVDDLALTSMARLWDVGKSEPIKVGKASPTEGTLPGAIYFILKYGESDFMSAAIANAMVGGDNASRSIAVGMVLGATYGLSAIPQEFKDGLNHWDHSSNLLESLPLLSRSSLKKKEQEL